MRDTCCEQSRTLYKRERGAVSTHLQRISLPLLVAESSSPQRSVALPVGHRPPVRPLPEIPVQLCKWQRGAWGRVRDGIARYYSSQASAQRCVATYPSVLLLVKVCVHLRAHLSDLCIGIHLLRDPSATELHKPAPGEACLFRRLCLLFTLDAGVGGADFEGSFAWLA